MKLIAASAYAILASVAAAGPPFFVALPDLPGGDIRTTINRLSADGGTIVGASEVGPAPDQVEAFRWTFSGGIEGLGFLPGHDASSAAAVSADGGLIVGASCLWNDCSATIESVRWMPPDDAEIDPAPIRTDFISDDLTISVYGDEDEVTIQRRDLGDQPIGTPPGSYWRLVVEGISGDGSTVIVGVYDTFWTTYFWTEAAGWQPIGHLGDGWSNVFGVSATGRYIVGLSSAGGFVHQAFRRDVQGGMIALGDVPGGTTYSEAIDASADGTVVVGLSDAGEAAPQDWPTAFIWSDPDAGGDGIRSLREVLETDYGFDLSGWLLTEVEAVSDDGRTIAGHGTRFGVGHAWVAHLGERCPADLDGDGDADAEDFFTYLDLFATGDQRADIDGDGDIDAEDFFGYLDLFAAGCD